MSQISIRDTTTATPETIGRTFSRHRLAKRPGLRSRATLGFLTVLADLTPCLIFLSPYRL